MGRTQKVIRNSAVVLTSILVLIAVLLWVLPLLIDSSPVKNGIIAHLTERLGAPLNFSRLELDYFPRPRLTLFDCRAKIGAKKSQKGSGHGTAEVSEIIAYPRIRPLLSGKIILARVEVEAPVVQWDMVWDGSTPVGISSSADPAGPTATVALPERLSSVVAILPTTRISVHDGRISLKKGGRKVFAVEKVQLALSDGGTNLTASGAADWCEAFSLAAKIEPNNLSGHGNLELQQVKPHRLLQVLAPAVEVGFTDSIASVTADLNWDQRVLQARLKASAPMLTFARNGHRETLALRELDTAYRTSGAQHALTMHAVVFDQPELAFSAEFGWGTAQDTAKSGYMAQIKSNRLEIAPLRRAALALGGDIKTVREIFQVMERGRVADFQASSYGNTITDLAKWEHLKIGGTLQNGAITLPTLKWQLKEVGGRADIADGILSGSNLEARYDTATGRNGEMKIGLAPGTDRFHLNIEVKTAVKQVRQVLDQLAPNPVLSAVVDDFTALKGIVGGRLLLGETFSQLKVGVATEELKISGRHTLLPYPFEISGGRFQYRSNEIALQQLSGSVNRSRFSHLAARFGLKAPAGIKSLKGDFDLQLNEIVNWWAHVGSQEAIPGGLGNLAGSVRMAVASLNGPVSNPSKWQYKAGVEAQQVEFTSPQLPAPVRIVAGQYKLQTNAEDVTVSVKDTRLKLADTELKVSGQLTGHKYRLRDSSLQVAGRAGRKAVAWLLKVLKAEDLIKSQPVRIKRAGLTWGRGRATGFSGDLSLNGDTELSGVLRRTDRRLSITNLVVHNATTEATMALELAPDQMTLDFNGTLDATTLNSVLAKTPFTGGRMTGKWRLLNPGADNWRLPFAGTLSGESLRFRLTENPPLLIDRIKLQTDENRLEIEALNLSYQGESGGISGFTIFTPNGPRVALDLTAGALDGNRLAKIWSRFKSGGQAQQKGGGRSGLLSKPVYGNLRINADSIAYDRLIWRPLQAEINLKRWGAEIAIRKAEVCGIKTPGTIHLTPTQTRFAFKPTAINQSLKSSQECFALTSNSSKGRIEGFFSLKSEIGGVLDGALGGSPGGTRPISAGSADLSRALDGSLEFQAREGRLYGLGVTGEILTKIFGILNITQIFVGILPDLAQEGMRYEEISARAKLSKGRLEVVELIVGATAMKLFSEGYLDLATKRLDFTVVAAPLRTIDRFITKLPVFKQLLPHGLVGIPIKVTGTIEAPTVVPLSPTAVGSRLLALTQRTLMLPINLIQSILPENSGTAQSASP